MNHTVLREVCLDATQIVDRIRRLKIPWRSPAPATPFVRRLEDAYECDWTRCPCVFVLSTGRVGSQTLGSLLALSPDVVAHHEPQPRLVKASLDAYLAGGDLAANAMWREVVYASRDDVVCEASRRGKIYVETNGGLTHLAAVLAACFPASKFIHLHRDPFEFVRSALRRGYYESHGRDFARVRPRPEEPLAAAWRTLPRLEKCAWLWSCVNHSANTFLATLPPERTLELRADHLFAGDEITLRRVFAFVGADIPPRKRLMKVLARKRSAASQPRSCDDWNDAAHESVWHLVAGVAKRIGYAADADPPPDPPRRWRDVFFPIESITRRARILGRPFVSRALGGATRWAPQFPR